MQTLETLPSSANATHPSESCGKKYLFIPTTDVVHALGEAGWNPVWAREIKTRTISRKGFQKHVIRFRQADESNQIKVGDSVAELVMVNSHDLSTRYRFSAGIYRLVCENGLIVSTAEFGAIKVRHRGSLEEIMAASMEMVTKLPNLVDLVGRMREKELSRDQQEEFAKKASWIRWGEQAPIDPLELLAVRRPEDEDPNLWAIFNRVQENLLRGGQTGRTRTGKVRQIQAVRGMQKEVGMNEQLWKLSETVLV